MAAAAAAAIHDTRIEILCKKLTEADLLPEERDGLADDLHRADQCTNAGVKDLLISNVRRALSEPSRIRREVKSVLGEHQTECKRAADLEKDVKRIEGKIDSLREDRRKPQSASSIEFTMPQILGGKPCHIHGGAVYLVVFAVFVIVFWKASSERKEADLSILRSEIRHAVTGHVSDK